MARITVEDCIDKFESRFELVLVAANRARKIHSGETPTVEKDNDKNTVIALREIADETIPVSDLKEKLVEEYQAVSMQDEEDLTLEYVDSENENKEDDDIVSSNDNKEDDDIVSSNDNEGLNLNDLTKEIDSLSISDNIIDDNVEKKVDDLSQNTEEDLNKI